MSAGIERALRQLPALSESAEILLEGLCDPDGERLDAELWADEIVELLDKGLVKLAGTLKAAELTPTELGRKLALELTTS